MKLIVFDFSGTVVHDEECESFEFRENTVENWIRIKYANGDCGLIYRVATIKCEEDK